MRACMRACVHACVCACVCARGDDQGLSCLIWPGGVHVYVCVCTLSEFSLLLLVVLVHTKM